MTSAPQTVLPVRREVEKNALVHKLERHQSDLLQLSQKLNSYICEPKTYSLFERIEFLKRGLESLRSENANIIDTIKEHRRSVEDYIDRIKEQFMAFHNLQQGVDEYVRRARNC